MTFVVIVIMRMTVVMCMRMSMVIMTMIVPTAGCFMAVVMATIMGMIMPTFAMIMIMIMVVSMVVITAIFFLGPHGGEVEQSHGHTTDATNEHHRGEDTVFANILALGQSTTSMKVNHNATPEKKEEHAEEMGADA
jgi:ABC-type transport system involved in cytochrome bd biosynthesis fused ATPase/permease subunit